MPPSLKFIKTPEGTGLLLFAILCITLLISNSPLHLFYKSFIVTPVQIGWGYYYLNKPALLWINDGLMALFFLSLSLEIKKELIEGELSHVSKAILPIVGAIGGITLPALIYFFCNFKNNEALVGWPIPTATDVALSLAAASALGKRVPTSLKTFLMALAIVDDVVAILIIALVYTSHLSILSIAFALLGIFSLLILNAFNVRKLTPYLLIGLYIWFCVLRSGVHATLAGVMVGFMIPFKKDQPHANPLVRLQKGLDPWVNYLILPLFIFFNGGFHFENFKLSTVFSRISLGVALGLWLGKMLGIFSITALFIKMKWAHKFYNANGLQLLGISALGGIGFTMSLFLASLAFDLSPAETLARQGILLGSVLSLITGMSLFYFGSSLQDKECEK